MAEESKSSPAFNAKLLYNIVADTMPMEGRDFRLKVENTEDGKRRLSIEPLTEIGRAFAPLLASKLAKPMGEAGVDVAGAAAPEVVTVRNIRARIEAEAAEARRIRIREAGAVAASRYAASQNARKARIAMAGEKSPESPEERAAAEALRKADAEVVRLRRIDERVRAIRVNVDKAAVAAAEKDEKDTGQSWAVDMDAVLTTTFDVKDAIAKFTEKERLIGLMAEHSVAQDQLGRQAVRVAKQYIIPKQ